jgi:hypothetical protein
LPLAGLTVIDFGQIFQGPYATFLLAKGGADVVKVEPLQGEPLRRRALPGKSATLPFAMLNQNKRAVTLNLKHARGRELLFEMVRRADVLLENFSPGTMDDLGVGWDVLHEINPRLIYATGTGFGVSGPDRDNLAMDLTIQAASGIMSVTGAPDRAVRARPQRWWRAGGPPRRGGDAGDGLSEPRGELRVLPPHRPAAAAHRQPPGRAVEHAVQCLRMRRRPCRDPCRDRGTLAQPGERDGAAGAGR